MIGLIYVNNPDSNRNYQKMKKIVNQIYKLFIVYSKEVTKHFVFFFLEMVFLEYFSYSSIDKWDGQLKTTKRDIRDFMI